MDQFLKMCRDAFLLDNSWTYYDALTAFDELAIDDEGDGDGGARNSKPNLSERLLDYESFVSALRRIARQSSAANETAQHIKRSALDDQVHDELEVRWEGFRQHVGTGLNAAPRSDEDSILMNFIYSAPVLNVSGLPSFVVFWRRVQIWHE